jgi:hypothetical protein
MTDTSAPSSLRLSMRQPTKYGAVLQRRHQKDTMRRLGSSLDFQRHRRVPQVHGELGVFGLACQLDAVHVAHAGALQQ